MLRRRLTPLSAVLAVATLSMGSPPRSVPTPGARIYDFELHPTARARGARGDGRMTIGWSPFGVAVNSDGYLIYDLAISTSGLIDPSRRVDGGTYVVWISSPDLVRVERLGILAAGALTTRITSWNKFIVLVTLERNPDAVSRSGPIVLQGRSPSGFMASFQSHELFNLIPH